MNKDVANSTAEKLRSKHVRTLELLQKTMNENNSLRKQLGKKALSSSNNGSDGQEKTDTSRIEEIKLKNSAQIEELKQNHESAIKILEKKLSDTAAEVAMKNSRITIVSAENMRLTTKCKVLQEQAQNATDASTCRIGKLESQIRELGKTLETRQESTSRKAADDLESVSNQLAQSTTEVMLLKDSLTKSEEQSSFAIGALKAEKEEVEAQLKALEKIHQIKLQDSAESSQNAEEKYQVEIQKLKDRIVQLERRLKSVISDSAALKETIKKLKGENQQLDSTIVKLAKSLKESKEKEAPERPSELPHIPKKSMFASHVDLKRENQLLRAQIEEMKDAQRRYVASVKKTTVAFPYPSSPIRR